MKEELKEEYAMNPEFWFKVISELSALLDSGVSEQKTIGDLLSTLRDVENEFFAYALRETS